MVWKKVKKSLLVTLGALVLSSGQKQSSSSLVVASSMIEAAASTEDVDNKETAASNNNDAHDAPPPRRRFLATNNLLGSTSCTIFPNDHAWNTRIDCLPVHANSDAYVNTIGSSTGIKADFGSGLWAGGPIGIPFVAVSGSQTKYPASFLYASESDAGPYAIPQDAPIEGGSASTGDRHVIAVDTDNCILYELFDAHPQSDNTWNAGSGVVRSLNDYSLRPDGWTSADAAGLDIFPGLVRYEEIVAGSINHAIRFTTDETREAYVWPARHEASSSTNTNFPPMGQRFRLNKSFDISGFSSTNQIILKAMKKYGIILADNGSPWYFSGVPDERWDNDDLNSLKHAVRGSNFEAVAISKLIVDPDSGKAKQVCSNTACRKQGVRCRRHGVCCSKKCRSKTKTCAPVCRKTGATCARHGQCCSKKCRLGSTKKCR